MTTARRFIDITLGALAGAGLLAVITLFTRPEIVRGGEEKEKKPVPVISEGMNGVAGGEYVMATSTSVHGDAMLFLLNTNSKVLSVYEAEGGSRSTRGVTFIAARKVDQEKYVTNYNDKSEWSYTDLLRRYQQEELRNKSLEDSPANPPTTPPKTPANESAGGNKSGG